MRGKRRGSNPTIAQSRNPKAPSPKALVRSPRAKLPQLFVRLGIWNLEGEKLAGDRSHHCALLRAGTPRMTALGVLLLAVAVPLVPTSPVSMQCTLGHEKSGSGTTANWPTYHFMNNVTRTASGTLLLEPLNDANAIAEYRGIYHVMMQVS